MKLPQFIHIKDRHHAAFVISAVAIGGLFLVTIIAVLTGKFTPFAFPTTPSPTTPRETVVVGGATLTYPDTFGVNRTVTSNNTQIVLAPYPSVEITEVKGLSDEKLIAEQVAGTISFKAGTNFVVQNKPWTAQPSTDRLKTELRDATVTNPLDALQSGYTISALVRPANSLAIRVDGLTNYEAPLLVNQAKPIIPADLNRTGASDNKIDDADINDWKTDLGKSGAGITPTIKVKDFNRDGTIDESDYARIFSEYYGTTGDTL